MSVTIVAKGDSVQLRGKNAMSKALIGLGWNPNEGQSNHAFDLDASVVGRDAAGNTVVVCYYHDKDPAPFIQHTGDNLTGEGDGDDEQVQVDLSQVPANVVALDVVVHIYEGENRGQSFGMVDDAFVRLVNEESGNEIRYDLAKADVFSEVALYFARIRRDGPIWAFDALGQFGPQYSTLEKFSNCVLPA